MHVINPTTYPKTRFSMDANTRDACAVVREKDGVIPHSDDMKRISALQLGHADEDPELVSVFVGVAS